jgi:predicted RNA methylase
MSASQGAATLSGSDWSKQISAKHGGKEYWFNSATGESRWTPPEEWTNVCSDQSNKRSFQETISESIGKNEQRGGQTSPKRLKESVSIDEAHSIPISNPVTSSESHESSHESRGSGELSGDCPPDLLWKRNYLFRGLPETTVSRLRMDVVASFSITESNSAKVMTKVIADAFLQLHQRSSRGVALVPCTIFDGMACVGGNTISFSGAFQGVLSNELDPNRFSMLKHNVADVMACRNVQFFNRSILEVAMERDDYNILFLDPEWGGPDYKEKTNLRLVISATPLEDFCLDVFRRKKNVDIIALKLPINYDNDFIKEFAERNNLNYAFFDRNLKRMTLTILTRKR